MGLLPPAMRVSGRRRYDQQGIRTLAVIGTAQRAGLSLDEIKVLLGASSDNGASIDRLRMIAEQKLPEITMLIEQTQQVQRWLEAASRCQCPLDDCQLFVDGAEPCA